jgi:single-strand DNA-binding protein
MKNCIFVNKEKISIYHLSIQGCPYGQSIFIFRSIEMNNLNSILIEGNLVRDAAYRTTPKGTAICTFPIASNRYYKQDSGMEKEVSFFDVESWSRLADACYAKGKKGRGVRVVGRLKQERWQNNEGKTMSKVFIVAEHVEFRPEFKKELKQEEETQTEEFAEVAENLVPTF